MTAMQLYVWGPALNCSSIDPKCIVAETYLRLIKQKYTVVKCNDPQMSPTGDLPLLKDGNTWVAGLDRILAHLVKRGKDGNQTLSEEQKADYFALSTLAQDKLYDYMLFTWYSDSTNFIKNIRPTYATLLSFPSNYIVPIQLKNNAKNRLAKYKVEITADDVGLPQNEKEEMKELLKTGWHKMYQLARQTYDILQSQLDDQDFMFGESPTTLDCILYGYLALHIYPDLAHKRLQHILTVEYPTLARYCDRVKQHFFPQDAQMAEESQAAQDVPSTWRTFINNPTGFLSTIKDDVVSYMGTTPEEEKEKSASQVEFERKRVWSIAGGITFLLAYVIYNGIVTIDVSDDMEEDDYYEDDDDYE